MVLWYVGCSEDSYGSKVQLFTADNAQQATPEESGYDTVNGPYDSKEEALDLHPDAV